MDIREYLKNNILITDGAMGTYFSEKTGDRASFCEIANISKPRTIEEIHREYISSGSKFIRTNTFSANTITLSKDRQEVREIIEAGYEIAKRAVGDREIYIGCSIGPMHESKQLSDDIDAFEEYRFIIDIFLEKGADIFVFETFGGTDYLSEISKYIKSKNKNAFILAQFAITADGFTRKGVSIKSLIEKVKKIENIDSYGFNCGLGPTHMYRVLEKQDIFNDYISALPNSSYPEIENGRMIYVRNPEYFSEIMEEIVKLGTKIVGGCCGTTPEHILKISEKLNIQNIEIEEKKSRETKKENIVKEYNNTFIEKLNKNEFVLAVELDPPFDNKIEKTMENARVCKSENIDIITVADSPRGIARVDSITVAMKIKREIGIDAMPHLCCRDKNLNGLKSGILGAYIEGIRNILAITGDPVLDIDKEHIKGVFDMNSYELISLIGELNEEIFQGEPISISGALNLNGRNKEAQLKRMNKKVDIGANVFFTQPIFQEEVIDFFNTMRKNDNIKILAGIMPIVSYKNALFLNNEVPGINVPQKYLEKLKGITDKKESEQIGIDIAVSIIEKIKDKVDGIYFITPFGRIEIIQKIMRSIKLK